MVFRELIIEKNDDISKNFEKNGQVIDDLYKFLKVSILNITLRLQKGRTTT